ncbi:MAG: XcyI family restriction endonuclease, partial [Candidatus Electrothrix sp. ATG2]|nr:XcyI family restriction endonuclease [Candidatus Electrothrix sp. ATG2]
FPHPDGSTYILQVNPNLLGYYRLLLGFSKKAFYTSHFGLTSFKSMEEKGTLSSGQRESLPSLCAALINSLAQLIKGVGINRISKELLDDLTLLTIGPQLRGGANVKKGIRGIIKVFEAIHSIVKHASIDESESNIELKNAADRKVVIKFAPDPDIVIQEEIAPGSFQNKIAIEVKAGTDFSNIHNRVGEAEKSHQKAKSAGYVECWTVVNVENFDREMAHRESPSTNRFYLLSDITSEISDEYLDFKARILALTGIMDK